MSDGPTVPVTASGTLTVAAEHGRSSPQYQCGGHGGGLQNSTRGTRPVPRGAAPTRRGPGPPPPLAEAGRPLSLRPWHRDCDWPQCGTGTRALGLQAERRPGLPSRVGAGPPTGRPPAGPLASRPLSAPAGWPSRSAIYLAVVLAAATASVCSDALAPSPTHLNTVRPVLARKRRARGLVAPSLGSRLGSARKYSLLTSASACTEHGHGRLNNTTAAATATSGARRGT